MMEQILQAAVMFILGGGLMKLVDKWWKHARGDQEFLNDQTQRIIKDLERRLTKAHDRLDEVEKSRDAAREELARYIAKCLLLEAKASGTIRDGAPPIQSGGPAQQK